MEIAILAVGLIIAGVILSNAFRSKKLAQVIEFEKKDAALKAEQDVTEKDIDELEKKLDEVATKAKDLDPKAVEDFWNKGDGKTNS